MTDLLVADIFDEMFDKGMANSARLIVFVAALAIFLAVGFYLISRIRSRYRESDVGSGLLLDNFREQHSRGQLSDEEYRNIKSTLAARLREEIQQSDQVK